MEVQEGRLVVCAFDPGIRTGWAWFDVDRIDMCSLGTRGGLKAADTDSVINGFPRVLMRLDLR